MTTNLNIDLLFKKYSEYFTYSQTSSTYRCVEEKPFVKVKASITQRDQFKAETVKPKSNKSTKLKPKTETKQKLTQSKKTKATISAKITPRPHVFTKLAETKNIKTEHKPRKSITPDKLPRKSIGKTSMVQVKKNANSQNMTQNIMKKHKKSKSKQRMINPLTDRSSKLRTERSRSKDGINTSRPSYQKPKMNKLKLKTNEKYQNREYPTMKTEYIKDNLTDSCLDENNWLCVMPQRQKLRNEQLFQQEQFSTPRIEKDMRLQMDIPLISSRQQQDMISQKQTKQQRQSGLQNIEQYYKQQIQRLKQQQEQKWKRAISILKQYKEVGNEQIIDKLIDESEHNRMSLNNRQDQSKQDRFKRYKSLYDEDNIKSSHHSLTKERIDAIKSRQASSKRLIQDLQKAEYNQIQLEHHFSSNQKEDNLLGSHHLNIQQYLLTQSKKGEISPRQDPPMFENIEIHQPRQQERSVENSLIDFIQNELRDAREQKQKQTKNHISTQVYKQILQKQIQAFTNELFAQPEMLHSFLQYVNIQKDIKINKNYIQQPEPQVETDAIQSIQCRNSYIIQLTRKFVDYIQQNKLEEFNKAVCIPFGQKPLKMLKFMRQLGQQRDQNQGGYQSIIPVSSFIDFEPKLKQTVKMSSTLEQYFFNHCVFDCINQNLDKLRPFGLKGLPPLCFKTNFSPPQFNKTQIHVISSLRNILQFGIGRQIGQQQQDDAFQIIDSTFRKLDRLILEQTDIEWKDNNDLQFQLKYDLSSSIIDWIFKEEAKELVYILF